MAYQGIFFDLGWTLMKPRRSWFLTDLFYELFPNIAKAPALDAAFVSCLPILHDNHKIDTLDQEEAQFLRFYQAVFEKLSFSAPDDTAIRYLAHDKVYNFKNYIFFEDALPVLTRLKQHYKLGVISDTWPSAVCFLKDAGLYELFDSFTFSYQFGVFKPEPILYQHALLEINLPPAQTIFVDDNPKCLEGARQQGILPIQILNNPNAQPAPQMWQVKNLTALESILVSYNVSNAKRLT